MIIAVGVILLTVGMVYRFSGELAQMVSTDERVTMKRTKLIKYRKQAQQQNALERRLVGLRERLEQLESILLDAQTPALAAVDIQNLLNRLAEESTVEIRSIQVLKVQADDTLPYTSIPVRVNFTSTLDQLKEMLYQIQASPKFLRIVKMHSRVANDREPDRISSIMTIEGFMKRLKDKTEK